MNSCVGNRKWIKSSYSGDHGGACVEVAVDWFKSSYSGDQGGACVEDAVSVAAVHVRDSKVVDGPQLSVAPGAWAVFVGQAVI